MEKEILHSDDELMLRVKKGDMQAFEALYDRYNIKSILVSLPAAIVASLCCVLPLVMVVLGIGSGTFMMYTMKYSYIFIPTGVIGVGLGYIFYFREKQRCHAVACRMAAGKLNLIALIFSTAVVFAAIVFNMFPEFIAPLFG